MLDLDVIHLFSYAFSVYATTLGIRLAQQPRPKHLSEDWWQGVIQVAPGLGVLLGAFLALTSIANMFLLPRVQ